jgi:uncharacterized sporulation protein YeaH/YhbH (DUF444 family)
MDDYRCDIVSDMSWWIDCWIRKFYEKVDRCYFVHDTRAQEVTEEQFYTYRYGGGTMCSSAFDMISAQLENRFPPHKFNIYVFYFTDGDNWNNDNEKVVQIIKEKLPQGVVNFIGITQVCSWSYEDSVKQFIDKKISDGTLDHDHVRTTYVGSDTTTNSFGAPQMAEDERNEKIIGGIRKLLSDVKAIKV